MASSIKNTTTNQSTNAPLGISTGAGSPLTLSNVKVQSSNKNGSLPTAGGSGSGASLLVGDDNSQTYGGSYFGGSYFSSSGSYTNAPVAVEIGGTGGAFKTAQIEASQAPSSADALQGEGFLASLSTDLGITKKQLLIGLLVLIGFVLWRKF